MILPAAIAHADWGTDPRKRQLALARLAADCGADGSAPAGSRYRVTSLASAPAGPLTGRPAATIRPAGPSVPAAPGGLFHAMRETASPGQALVGFDFPIGLPLAYAAAADITSFTDFLSRLGKPPWEEFASVARCAAEISLRRPFYPKAPGGTKREHLSLALRLTSKQLRRCCEKTDAEILFWTLGPSQVGKGALLGWQLLAAARRAEPGIAIWPFDGVLADLLDGTGRVVVAETYPREFYQHFRPREGLPGRWSKRRRDDRLKRIPGLLTWAASLGVSWDPAVLARVEAGFSAGSNGEDEFDAVVGLLGMIGVVTGAFPTGEPRDHPPIAAVEGWILGR